MRRSLSAESRPRISGGPGAWGARGGASRAGWLRGAGPGGEVRAGGRALRAGLHGVAAPEAERRTGGAEGAGVDVGRVGQGGELRAQLVAARFQGRPRGVRGRRPAARGLAVVGAGDEAPGTGLGG